MTTLRERIEKGVRLLDQQLPGWADKIDVDRLEIASQDDCILGQLYMHYETGTIALRIDGIDYGFNLDSYEWNDDKYNDEIQDTWVTIVRNRQAN